MVNSRICLLYAQIECKIALQKELGLPIRPDCPMVKLHKYPFWILVKTIPLTELL